MKSKQIIIMLLSFIILFAIGCDNEDKTGSGGSGIGGGSGGGGISGGGSGGLTEILTPEEDAYYDITMKVVINSDSTVQISGNSAYIQYDNNGTSYFTTAGRFNCKTSDWAKESGTDYKISKSIISEAVGNLVATSMNNAEAKWRYTTNRGVKYIELDLKYLNGGNPYRAVVLKKATR